MAFTADQIKDLVDNAEYAYEQIKEGFPDFTPATHAQMVMVILRADAETIREQKAKPIPKAMR